MWRHHRRKFKVGRPAVKIKFKDLLLHISFLFLSSLCLATALPIKDDKRCNDIGQKKKEPKELFIVDKCPKIINDVICYMVGYGNLCRCSTTYCSLLDIIPRCVKMMKKNDNHTKQLLLQEILLTIRFR
jgi:hypothetical protein